MKELVRVLGITDFPDFENRVEVFMVSKKKELFKLILVDLYQKFHSVSVCRNLPISFLQLYANFHVLSFGKESFTD